MKKILKRDIKKDIKKFVEICKINYKKMIIFTIIVLLVIIAIDIIPVEKITNLRNNFDNCFMLGGDNPINNNMSKILKSNIDQQYRSNVFLMFAESAKAGITEENGLYKVLLYFSLISTVLIGIIGYFITRVFKNKKYIGYAFITGSIISLLLILSYTYYMYTLFKYVG